MTNYEDELRARRAEARKDNLHLTIGALVIVAIIVGVLFALTFGWRAFNRNQQLADARNRVKISAIEIRNQEQRVIVAKQKAQIRHEEAIGVRSAQDEIAKTLTPLYVQFEMVEVLKEIARSGKNNSVVFIPSGPNGIPVVQPLPDVHGGVGSPASK